MEGKQSPEFKKSVYIETSVLSYLTARSPGNLVAAARQQITRDWWNSRKWLFEVFVSPLVEQESRRGDTEAAARRLESLLGLAMLEIVEDAYVLASTLISRGALPPTAQDDAMHIALATVHGMDYLLTWNCKHIDNAEMKPIVRLVCGERGYICPEICTPQELMGECDES